MGTKTPIDAGFIARAVAGVRFAFTGKGGDWFGPAEPMQPVAPDEVKGRKHDFPFAVNLQATKPRQGEPITFDQLRALADNYDLLRLVIEKRKDQLEQMSWTVQRRDMGSTPRDERQQRDARTDAAIEFFKNPDRSSGWAGWLRQVIEDLLVLDAPALYVRRTRGGGVYALEPVDGATIKRVLDGSGRTPAVPATAYQQVLKGMPAVDYTAEELIYRPRNLRTHKVYGFGPVEQIIATVNIALRRQASMLEYYRSGNVPDALIGVPADWTPEQIRQWQEWWDAMLEGNLAERRKTKFVPGELSKNFMETKQPPLKDLFDEWLARVVCFAFSIEPTPFVSQVNRATSETSREQSQSDGLLPLKNWVKSLIDDLLALMDMPDLEFVWNDAEAVDAKARAEINCQYVAAGILTRDEVRAEMGRDPLPDGQGASIAAAPATADEGKKPGDEDKEQPYLGKALRRHRGMQAKKPLRPISRDRQAAMAAEKRLTAGIEAFLQAQAEDVAEQLADALGLERAEKADEQEKEPGLIERAMLALALLDFSGWAELIGIVGPELEFLAFDGAKEAVAQVGGSVDAGLLRSHASRWASERAAEMVGMKWIGGQLVPNPAAQWQITEGTRQMLRRLVVDALDGGWSTDRLAAEIRKSTGFGRARAETIARTELARADTAGQVIGWRESGLVEEMEWCTAAGCCDFCQSMHGKRANLIDELFPGGVKCPAHPNCKCDAVAVQPDETTTNKAYNPGQPRDRRGRWTAGGGVVGSLVGNELGQHATTKDLRKAAMAYAEQNLIGKSFRNEVSGHSIKVTRQGIKHALSRANYPEITLVPALKQMLEKASYMGGEPDKAGRAHIFAAHKYRARVRVGGKVMNVGIVTHEKRDGHEHYDHFILRDQ